MRDRAVTFVCLVGLLASGCGSGDQAKAVDAASDAADRVEQTAANAVDAVAEAAEESAQDDPVARCLELAAEKNWKEALEPCSKAVKEKPDDLAIKHALQQAQAAAKE